MPVSTGAACLTNADCPVVPLPMASAGCIPALSFGGINDVYFLPCTEAITETNVLDTAWWTALITNSHLGNVGAGIGSIGKKTAPALKTSSCRPEQIISLTWSLKFLMYNFDKTSADATRVLLNGILTKATQYQVIARMCDGDNTVLPIGRFSLSDIDWVVPDSFETAQNFLFELSWIEFAVPKIYTVAGLSAIVPKA